MQCRRRMRKALQHTSHEPGEHRTLFASKDVRKLCEKRWSARAQTASGEEHRDTWREHERHRLALQAQELLEVAEKVAKVNVEEMPVLTQHDVVIVPIAHAEHVTARSIVSREGRKQSETERGEETRGEGVERERSEEKR